MIRDILTKIRPSPIGLGVTFDTDSAEPTQLIYSEWHNAVRSTYPYTAGQYAVSGDALNMLKLMPTNTDILRHHVGAQGYKELALLQHRDHEIVILLQLLASRELTVHVAATTAYAAGRTAAKLIEGIEPPKPPPPPPDDKVQINIWQYGAMGPDSHRKVIRVPLWDEVNGNYPDGVGDKLTPIMTNRVPEDEGKIILWYGEPGTGKTSAIRSLMRQWKPWCEFHYISDPERMFQYPNYLLHVGVGDGRRWRLIIAEDTDEFLKIDARNNVSAGASMSRLLNFSDGILGQGSNTMFLLTTNERVDNLHPAIIRPGRCYQHLCFRPFTDGEAADWLSNNSTTMELPKKEDEKKVGFTLADLISFRKGAEGAPTILEDQEVDDEDDEDDYVEELQARVPW